MTYNKQLERTVTRHRVRAACAPFHYAHAARWIVYRAAAQLRRYAARDRTVAPQVEVMRQPVNRRLLERGTCTFVVSASLLLGSCEPSYHDVSCWLPSLRTDETMPTLINVGDGDDRSSDTCSVPTARAFEVQRAYGNVTFYWWGSPHRLYFSGSTADGQPLGFRGDRVEVYDNTSGSFLAEYSHRITFFQGESLLDKPAPEHVVIEILGPDGRSLEAIQAEYEGVLCSCSVPDYLTGARP